MPLRVAIPDLVSPSYFPAIAAVELGYFKAQGLDAAIELVFPVTRTYEMLRDGAIAFAGGAAHAALYAFPDWRGCRLLAALGQRMYWFLVVRRDLNVARGDLRALKGLRIGAAPGPVDGLRRMLREAGVDPERELSIGPIPAAAAPGVSFGVAAAAALAERRIDGFWANGMGAELALRSGDGTLVIDARRGDGPPGAIGYTFPALSASAVSVERDPGAAAAAVRALTAAQRDLRADPGLAVRAAARLFPPAETGLIAELVRRDAPFYDAAISADSVAAMNRFSREIGILSRDVPYEEIVALQLRGLWSAAG